MVIKKLHKDENSKIEEIIDRGGQVSADKKTKSKEWYYFPLRLRRDISTSIDRHLEVRAGMSKTAWILEAIQEKLKKEGE